MKKTYVFSAVLAVSVLLTATTAFKPLTEPADDLPELVKLTLPMMEMAKMHTLEVLDAMPEDQFSYQPTEVNKSFAAQMVHIAYSTHYFDEVMLKGNRIQYQEPDPESMSKAEIREMMSANFDAIISTIKSLSNEDLEQELPFGPNKTITRGQALIFAHDHVTNHRAKANLYLRLNGIEPPNYKFL
ncbi:MAG: DinB family protein [Cyclobacteriaceae bacterium]